MIIELGWDCFAMLGACRKRKRRYYPSCGGARAATRARLTPLGKYLQTTTITIIVLRLPGSFETPIERSLVSAI